MDSQRQTILLAIVVAMGASALAAAPATAQVCQERCTEWDADGACIGHIWDCPPGKTPYDQSSAQHYGAIAYGPKSTAYGYSYSWSSQAEAERTAMKNCAQHGNDCEVAVWFKQQCGAVVADAGADYYWGLGGTKASALAEAKKSCAKQGGKICQEKVSQCSQ